MDSTSELPSKDRNTILAERQTKKLLKKIKKSKAKERETKPLFENQIDEKPKSNYTFKNILKESKSNKTELKEKQHDHKITKNIQETTITNTSVKKLSTNLKSEPFKLNISSPTAPPLFNHLFTQRSIERTSLNVSEMHSKIVRLGIQYRAGSIIGSNARCLAMLAAFKILINDFSTSTHEIYNRSLETMLQKSTTYLQSCRPLAVSMTNTLRFLKFQLTQLSNDIGVEKGKKKMITAIKTYIREEIDVAGQAISSTVQSKIHNGDIILTLGYSSLINRILIEARQTGKRFQVIVVEAKLFKNEAIEMVRRLVKADIKCEYCLITSVCCQIHRVNLVFLGVRAILANGYVMSRIGTAQVALIARTFNKPVLVCSETYKSSERVQTDSFVYNEIAEGSRANLILKNSIESENNDYIIPLNLTYDVTPPELITAVVTELAILPCTSVPVILRVKPTDN